MAVKKQAVDVLKPKSQAATSLTEDIRSKGESILSPMKAGVITGAAGNDPSGIATYSLSGIVFGYAQLWLIILATPMLVAVQSMAARVAAVTKKGLSANFRIHFSRKWSLFAVCLLLTANILTIGADIAAMSEAMSILIPGTSLIQWVVPISFITWYIVVFFNYKEIAKYLLWLVLVFVSFVISAFLARPDWQQVLTGIIKPSFTFGKEYLVTALAMLGTTISPYMIYWEAHETIEDKATKEQAKYESFIQAPGFILSNFISFMIIVSTGTLLHGHISGDITASQVAQALAPVAGVYASKIFAIGILGAGFLAVPVLAASAAFALCSAMGWREGLSYKPTQAKGFYEVISIAILIGVQIAISGIDPIKALFYSQVVSGILMPPLVFMLLILANKKSVMGKLTNGWFSNVFGTLTLIAILGATVGLFL